MPEHHDFRLGEHDALIAQLLRRMDAVQTSLDAINQTLAEQRGERKAAMWGVSLISAVLGSMGTHMLALWRGHL